MQLTSLITILEAQMLSEVTEGTRMIPIFKKIGIILGISSILDVNRSKCRKALCTSLTLDHVAIDWVISVFPLTPHAAAKKFLARFPGSW